MSEQINWNQIRRDLGAPFYSYYVGWKAQATSKDKSRAMAVSYIDARTVMDRLDAVVGPGNWSDRYRLISAGEGEFAVECTLTVCGVSKADVGTADEADEGASTAKSAYSDALKRAAVKWGIGRYLYRIPRQWVAYDAARKQLAEQPELPAWALPGGSGGNGYKPTGSNGAGDKLAQARSVVLPFGTRSHPEYKGKTLGDLATINGELIAWLADEFEPTSDEGQTVQDAARVIKKAA